jgi:hypothetical protein
VPAQDELTVTGRDEVRDPEVESYLAAGRLEEFGGHVDAAHAHPPLGPFTLHGNGLGNPAQGTVIVHLDLTDAEQVEATVGLFDLPAAPVLPLQRVEPLGGLEPREAWCVAVLFPPVKGGEGPVEALQRSSTEGHARRENLGAQIAEPGQRSALADVTDRAMVPLPGTHALLQGGIVELALVVELCAERQRLANGGCSR